MPEISRFFGIIIRINYNDHAPPHFHAWYDGSDVSIDIRTLALLRGSTHPRVLALVIEWAAMHREELMADWELARTQAPLRKIAPLV